MDAYIAEESLPSPLDGELDGRTVSLPERSQYPQPDPQTKISSGLDAPNGVSPSKGTLEEATPKANPSILPSSNIPSGLPARPTIQRSMSAAASYHRSRHQMSAEPSSPSAPPTESPSDGAPTINVVPSSPLASTGMPKTDGPPNSPPSTSEMLTRRVRDSTLDRRSSRRRSEMDVSCYSSIYAPFLMKSPLARLQSKTLWLFLKYFAYEGKR